MPPVAPEGDEPGAQDVADLLHRARIHQQQAEQLLARAEAISRRGPLDGRTARPGAAGGSSPFTERERNVIELLIEGMSNRMIARTLDISERTVKNHLYSIFHKLGVGDRTQAVILLMRGVAK